MKSLAFKILPSLCSRPSYPPSLDYYYTILSLNARGMGIPPWKTRRSLFINRESQANMLNYPNYTSYIFFWILYAKKTKRGKELARIDEVLMHPRTDASYISFVLPHPLFRKMRTRDSHGHLNRFDSISRRVSRGPPNGFHQLVKHSGSHP